MPFYDYKCSECGQVAEYYENTEDNKKEHRCKSCNSLMYRQMSTLMFRFIKRKGLNLSATERKSRWNSPDPKDKI